MVTAKKKRRVSRPPQTWSRSKTVNVSPGINARLEVLSERLGIHSWAATVRYLINRQLPVTEMELGIAPPAGPAVSTGDRGPIGGTGVNEGEGG